MDYKSFFEQYPDAVLLKVGEKHYPSHMRAAADFEARTVGAEVEEVTAASLKASGSKGKIKSTTDGAE